MGLEYPHFLVNYKVYDGTAGEDGLALARTLETVAEATNRTFAVAPQTPDVRLAAEETSLPVVAQSVDALEPGRGNGRISIQALAAAGADGVLVNHPENRATLEEVERTVARCGEFGLESIVCVAGREMGEAALAFGPDCLLLEKPEDVATGRAITRTHPELVEEFVAMVDDRNPRTKVLVGGGISSADDVARAFDLGADAAGAASAVLEASDRRAWLTAVAEAMPRRLE